MAYTLEDFCADARAALDGDSGPEGRERVARHLEKLLVDPGFVVAHLGPDKPSGAETIHVDETHGFRVMAHTNRGPSNNTPHCHGPSWVVYGMAMNHVEMTEWRRVDDGSREGHAELAVDRKYVLREGEAHVYNEGVIHSLDRPLETRLVRVCGCDLDRTLRYRYDPAKNAVRVLEPQTA